MSVYKLNGKDLSLREMRRIAEGRGIDFGSFVEELVAHAYQNVVAAGDVVVDGGAARGWHTFSLAKLVGPKGRVHAVEALADNCEFLRTRARQWRYEEGVVVHELALGTENGSTKFQRVVEHAGLSGIKRAWLPADAAVEEIEVPLRKLEDIIPVEEWARLTFIKLDLEGGEFTALKHGAEKLIAAARPIIVFENGRQAAAALYSYTETEFFGFFDRLNYDLIDIFAEPFTRDVFATGSADAPFEFVAIPVEARSRQLPQKLRAHLEARIG